MVSSSLRGLTLLGLAISAAQGADYYVTNVTVSGAGSLAQAINDANANPGVDKILFNISGSSRTIQPSSALPAITEAVTIDATSQPGYAGAPVVELNGALAGSGTPGLKLLGGGCTVRGFVINRFSSAGILIQGPGGNVIENNYIGTDLSGAASAGNTGAAILISRSSGNIIGGTNSAQRNVLSGGNLQGVYLGETVSVSNVIQGNYIGVAANGSTPLGNTSDGVMVYNSPSNVVGGLAAGAGNVISGNGRNGITLADLGTRGNVVRGNLIGLDAAGGVVVSNAANGILIDRASGNFVGGREAHARNVISGNQLDGVGVAGSTAGGNTIQGNYIGTDAAGTGARGNRLAGIALSGPANTQIGGVEPGEGNVISANRQEGILVSTNSHATRVQGNFIGVDASGTRALGNHLPGVAVNSAAFTLIGGTTPAARNIISGNDSLGVWLLMSSARSNMVQGNFIGTDVSGRAALKNGDTGVLVENAPENLIGGPGAGNVISGNASAGIVLRGGQAQNNRIEGNLVGVDADGRAALGNAGIGVLVSGAPANTIGGIGAGVRNIISGNGNTGIYVLSNSASGTVIRGNYVGTDLTGMAPLPNGQEGIYILWSSTNLIGGAEPGAGNVISGNSSWGLFLTNSSWNLVQGNMVGVGADGETALANGRVVPSSNIELGVSPGDGAHDNTFGGSAPGAGNRIAYAPTVYSGIRIRHVTCTNNWISGNSIFSNGRLGINLGGSGVNANDGCDASVSDISGLGGNLLRNFPELTNVIAGADLRIRGRLNTAPGLTYTLEFFANPSCNAQGYGEGRLYLGQALLAATACTNYFSFTLPVVLPAGFEVITATSTDPYHNTSEFSACQTASRVPEPDIAADPAAPSSVKISWQNTSLIPGLALWETESLSEPVNWTKTTNNAALISGRRVVTITVTNGNRFFRLDAP